MPTLAELRNEWAEAVAKAQELAAGRDQDGFDRAWADAETKRRQFENMERADAAEKALEGRGPTVTDLRDPNDAKGNVVPNVSAAQANAKPNQHIEVAPGKFIPFATKTTEGYNRRSPASVQLPEIMARYEPGSELWEEADLQRRAMNIYLRKGLNATEWNDPNLRRALNALQEDTDSEGGYLVPTDQRVELIHDPGNRGGALRGVSRVLQTSRDGGTIPTGSTITWAGIAEEATPTVSDPAFNQVTFTIRKSGANMLLSEELLSDSAVNLPAFIGTIVDEESGEYEDQQGIEGDGTTEPLGLRTTGPAANGGAISDITDLLTLAAPTLTEIVSAYFELPAQFRGNATWYTTSSFMARVASISATGGQQWILPDGSGRPQLNILGAPVIMFDGTGWDNAAAIAANEEVGAIGDFSKYVFMDRLGVVVRRDDSLGFASDQVYFKARKRYDSFYTLANAFRILKAAAS